MGKVLVMLGSPRKKGNSTILAEKAMEGITAAGGSYEAFSLNDMKIKPCQACDYCRTDEKAGCCVDDDMQLIYEALPKADTLVLCSPVYMFNMSAQLKLFLDRCYAVLDVLKGKKVAILLAYADTDEIESGAINAIKSLQDQCRYVGADIVEIIHGSADKAGDILSNEALLERAYVLGKVLAK